MTDLQILQTSDRAKELSLLLHDIAGQLAPSSRRIYTTDGKHFSSWLTQQGISLSNVSRTDMIDYRAHLAASFARVTANRMFTTARRLLKEAVLHGILPANPSEDIRGFRTGDNESPHQALTKSQVKGLLAAIDRSTAAGPRDYALLMLLIRTGLRRAECAALTLGDFSIQQGHHVLTIQHGKGDKRRTAKIPVDVMRSISDYLEITGRKDEGKEAPLFVAIDRHGNLAKQAMTDRAIANIVKARSLVVGIEDITPHCLRATFVTLALESGARLEQVQYFVGHKDPLTTERYQKRKMNLDDSASDYIKL